MIYEIAKVFFKTIMLKKIKTLLYGTASVLALHSCMPEEFNTNGKVRIDEINPEYAIPLISSDLTLDDLVKKGGSFVKKYDDGFISLVYRGQIYSSTAGEVIPIPDQDFNQTIVLNSTQAIALSNGQSIVVSLQTNKSFSLGSKEIDSLWLKAGALVASISSEIRTGGSLKISFEDAKNLGTVLSVNIPFGYGGSTPVMANGNTTLAGYKWNMSKGGAGFNMVNIKFE